MSIESGHRRVSQRRKAATVTDARVAFASGVMTILTCIVLFATVWPVYGYNLSMMKQVGHRSEFDLDTASNVQFEPPSNPKFNVNDGGNRNPLIPSGFGVPASSSDALESLLSMRASSLSSLFTKGGLDDDSHRGRNGVVSDSDRSDSDVLLSIEDPALRSVRASSSGASRSLLAEGETVTVVRNPRFRPDDSEWITSVVYLMIFPLALAVLCLLFIFFFFILRCCCGVCGRSATRRYEPGDVRVTMVGSAFCSLLIIIGGIIGYVGNGKFSDGILGFFDATKEAVDRILGIGTKVNDILEEIGQNPSDAIKGAASSINENIDNAKDDVVKYDDVRKDGLNGIFVLPIVAVLFVLLAMITRAGALAWGYVFFAWFGVTFAWIIVAVHVGFQEVMNDICADIDFFVTDPLNGGSGLDKIGLQCPDHSDSTESKESLFAAATASYEYAIFENKWPSNQPPPTRAWLVDGASPVAGSSVNVTHVNALKEVASELGKDPSELLKAAMKNLELSMEGFELVRDFETCKVFTDIIDIIRTPICGTFKDGIDLVLAGSALQAIFLLPGILFAVQGIKRFKKQSDVSPEGVVAGGVIVAGAPPPDPGYPPMKEVEMQEKKADSTSTSSSAPPKGKEGATPKPLPPIGASNSAKKDDDAKKDAAKDNDKGETGPPPPPKKPAK